MANTDYHGGSVGAVLSSASAQVCCAQCRAAKGCAFATWLLNGAAGGQCYLKAAAAVPYTRPGRTGCAPKSGTASTSTGTVATAGRGIRGPGAMPHPVGSTTMPRDQRFSVGDNGDGTVTIHQGALCIDNNFRP